MLFYFFVLLVCNKTLVSIMPKLVHLRRSTRHGLRRSTRVKPKKLRRRCRHKPVKDSYDRDLGGYKWVSAHQNRKWHATKRSRQQLKAEERLCQQLKRKATSVSDIGYAVDSFFVEEDTGEVSMPEETDALFAVADACSSDESDEADEEEWSETWE